MNAVKITVCILDNGSASQMERTQKSLKAQTSQDFAVQTLSSTAFWPASRNTLPFDTDYILYLYSGSVLNKKAIAICNKAITDSAAPWYYFDERNFDAEINDDALGISDKPDFDPIGIASHPYWNEGVLFSADLLRKLQPHYEGPHFGLSLIELFLCAAAECDGVHIPQNLLVHHNRPEISLEEQALVRAHLHTMLDRRGLPLRRVDRPDAMGLYLFPQVTSAPKVSLILLGSAREDALPVPYSVHEVIPVSGPGSYRELCMLGAKQAKNDLICVLDASCTLPSPEEFDRMAAFAALPNSGFVSPQLHKADKILYAGVSSLAGQILQIPKNTPTFDMLSQDIFAVRETSVPAWQFWMAKKDLFFQVEANIDAGPDPASHSREFTVMDYAYQAKQLKKSSLYIGDVQAELTEVDLSSASKDFCAKLFRWKGKDAFCPATVRSWSYAYAPMRARSFFPDKMEPYSKDKKKIFILTHELSLTGAPIVLSHGVQILKDAGWQILMVAPSDGVLKQKFLDMEVPVLILEDMDTNEDWLHMAADFDLILVNTIVPHRQIDQLRDFPVPVIWWLHDARSGYETDLKDVLPDTIGDNIHTYAVSRYAESAVNDYRPQYPTQLLLYGLKDEAARVIANPKPIENAHGKKVFISIGTIVPRKGQDILVKAIRNLPETVREDCLFLFIGKPVNKDMLKQVKELEAEFPESVRQINSVPHEEVFHLFRQATAVICSSRDDPLPTFMAETMMVSGVCICSENTGTAPAITHGKNGFIYHNDDPLELAQCICQVSEAGDLSTVRTEARKLFEEVFSLEVFQKNLLRIVSECTETNAGECNYEG